MTVVHHAARSHTHRVEVPVGPDTIEETAGILWHAGALGLWERSDHLVAWFREPVDAVPAGATWSIEPDRDWQARWKATIEPVTAGRITVIPSWLAHDHHVVGLPVAADPVTAEPVTAEPVTAEPVDDPPMASALTIVLDPGRAFGTGHHATTTQCLELLDALELRGRTVADVGCGSGILAIAAAMRGARVVAVDIDPDAVDVTGENAGRNGVEVDARVGSVDALPGRADIVVANLVTDVVTTLASQLVAATKDVLIVSGIATERRARVVAALTGAGATVEDVRERDGWLAIQARVPDKGTGRAVGAAVPDRTG